MQRTEYPHVFPSTNWTCVGSLFNRDVKNGYAKFVQNRKTIMRVKKGVASEVPWGDMDMDLVSYVLGLDENWGAIPWESCDHIYGIENIGNQHWVAYAYRFAEKAIMVYDSMKTHLNKEREEVFHRHAAIAPSLYNVGLPHGSKKMDPDTPFKVSVIDVPQQKNNDDCGVYGIKFIQCLASKSDYNLLEASHFGDYRKRLAVDLIKWRKSSSGGLFFAHNS